MVKQFWKTGSLVAVFVLVSALYADEAKAPPTVENMPPVVVKTEPMAGLVNVDPATAEIKVTFSKPMITGNFSFVQTGKETFPQTTDKPRYLEDEKTCVLPVKLEPEKTYVIWINQGKFNAFMDPDGNRAVPYLLVFQTRRASH